MDDIVVVGGGPSGLAAAHEAAGYGAKVVVLELLERVGGLARTLEFEGSRFDIGPHRFFTKNKEIDRLFAQIVGEDLLRVPRKTRILHGGIYYDYPLTPLNAMYGIGACSGLKIAASYSAARLRAALRPPCIESFEDWVVDRFGRRLYEQFFKTYTEKVWGISCGRISAAWAEQRIRGLNLAAAVRHSLLKRREGSIKTLVDEFAYPRKGAGQTYEKLAERIGTKGGKVLTRSAVRRIRREGMHIRAVEVETARGENFDVEGKYFLVSAPLTELIEMMDPASPPEISRACRSLRYRNHIGVNLLVEGCPFPDCWIYIHDPHVAMARITNYRNFSPDMASDPSISPMTIEYFTFPGDELERCPDDRILARTVDELMRIRIMAPDQIIKGFVVRSPMAYPVIEMGHKQHLSTIKSWLDQFANLLPIGRSGMFKYNNQDHAMATGLLAARTAVGHGQFDPWLVNIDAEYHEATPAGETLPERARDPSIEPLRSKNMIGV